MGKSEVCQEVESWNSPLDEGRGKHCSTDTQTDTDSFGSKSCLIGTDTNPLRADLFATHTSPDSISSRLRLCIYHDRPTPEPGFISGI